MKIFTIVGWSGSGKTRLIAELIRFFQDKKKKVITLKNIPKEYSLQPEGKDSEIFLSAGSETVFLNTHEQLLIMARKKESPPRLLEELSGYVNFKEVDYFLCEGKTLIKSPLIEVHDPVRNDRVKYSIDKLAAVVCDLPLDISIPVFSSREVAKIAHFMEQFNTQFPV